MVDIARDVERSSTVQVLRWVIVDILHLWRVVSDVHVNVSLTSTYQVVDVVHSEIRAGIPVLDLHGVRCAVVEDRIDRHDRLEHPAADLGQVAALVLPVLVRSNTAEAGHAVLRSQVQGSHVENDEEASTIRIHPVELVVHAVHVGCDVGACNLFVLDEGRVAEIVSPDPNGVHSRIDWVVHELSAIGVVAGRIGQICRHFVPSNVWEGRIDRAEVAGRNLVAADCTADGVVVDVGAGVLLDVSRPDATTVRSVKTLGTVRASQDRALQ